MPEHALRTLADYADAHDLRAFCTACNRQEPLNMAILTKRLGRDATLADVRRRVRCTQCGKKTGEILVTPARSWTPS